ncbi:hypothetical protein [Pseudooceanicola sp. LIPI14-2-Ac024]|uniref:hypothetical protein n=1 Tax=Pseudooceanicola sp. LIPI14-2-Ac024 TaxID=3344875 RepID=UPI0035CEF8D7
MSLFATLLLLTSQPVTAQMVAVEFHAFSSTSPEKGVHAKIKVIYPDERPEEFETNLDGRKTFRLKACDATVVIEARSVWGGHTKATKSCDPVPVELAMEPTAQASIISDVLKQAISGEAPAALAAVSDQFLEFKEAVSGGDVVRAAELANDLQWTLYQAGDESLAYEYGVFAQSAGFEAITDKQIITILPEKFDFKGLMSLDKGRDIVVMSDEGKLFLKEAQRELGTEQTGAWDAKTFDALRSVEPKT